MEDKFTDAELRLARMIKKTPKEARDLLKASQKKLKDAADLDFTKPVPGSKKAKPP